MPCNRPRWWCCCCAVDECTLHPAPELTTREWAFDVKNCSAQKRWMDWKGASLKDVGNEKFGNIAMSFLKLKFLLES